MTIDTLLNLLPLIATIFLTACYVPQVITTIRTKNVEGMSLAFWIMLNIALTCLLVNSFILAVVHGTWGYAVSYILNEGLAFVMLVLVLKYRNKK